MGALLDKRVMRLADVPHRNSGFEVPDEFPEDTAWTIWRRVRNLPFIAVLRPDSKP